MEPMGQNLTLSTSPTGRPPAAVPSGYALRSVTEADLNVLGHLYYDSYPPGVAGDNLDEAITDIEASFRGDYGELWPEASPVAVTAGELVAVIMTVTRPPGEDAPDCPFIIEASVHPAHRKRGLARAAMVRCFDVVEAAGEVAVALRVDSEPLGPPALPINGVSAHRLASFGHGEHRRPGRVIAA